MPDHWREWLGTFQLRGIDEADFWLVALAPAERPEIADELTAGLEDRVHELYHALVIGADDMAHGPALKVSGANVGGGAHVRGAQSYPQANHVAFGPRTPITESTAAVTQTLLSGLRALKVPGRYRRVWRIVRTFYGASQLSDLGERIHQHVRSVEGFLFPRKGATRDDFVERSRLFVERAQAAVMGEIFDIRSAVEHLHGPFRFLPSVPERDRRLRLLRRGIQAEGVARHALRRFLTTPALFRFYEDDQALEQFWYHLQPDEQCDLWAPLVAFDMLKSDFKDDWITDEDLDLT